MDGIIGTAVSFLGSGIFGGIIGGIFRLAPEIIGYFKRRQEFAHEIDMQRLQMERDKLLHDQALQKLDKESQIVLDKGGLEALKEAIRAQARPSGIKWVDAMSASVRPVATYWYMALYSLVKLAMLTIGVVVAIAALGKDADFISTSLEIAKVFVKLWGPEDMALFSGIMNFWFLDRTIRKNQGN